MTVGVDRPVVHQELPKLNGYDVCVVDGAAKTERMSVSTVKAADLVLVPVQPSSLDIWATERLVELIQARQEAIGTPDAAFLASRAITGTRLADGVEDALAALELPLLETCIHQRVAYAEATNAGLSVLDTAKGSKAAAEIEALTDEVLARL